MFYTQFFAGIFHQVFNTARSASQILTDFQQYTPPLFADLAIIHAWKADPEGNLIYRKTARNFNPIMATAAKVTVVEVEDVVASGQIDPDHIVTAGIFVQRIVHVPDAQKRIEQRTTRKRA
mgnify:CR=1 FL=1